MVDTKFRRRSYVSSSVGRLFAGLIALWGLSDTRQELKAILSRPVCSVSDGVTDAAAKLAAWLMAMALLVPCIAVVKIIGGEGEIAVGIVDVIADVLAPLGFMLSTIQSVRIGVLWRESDWSIDRRTGFKGWLQNPGDLDVVVCGALYLAVVGVQSAS